MRATRREEISNYLIYIKKEKEIFTMRKVKRIKNVLCVLLATIISLVSMTTVKADGEVAPYEDMENATLLQKECYVWIFLLIPMDKLLFTFFIENSCNSMQNLQPRKQFQSAYWQLHLSYFFRFIFDIPPTFYFFVYPHIYRSFIVDKKYLLIRPWAAHFVPIRLHFYILFDMINRSL